MDEFVLFARREKIIRHIFGENSMDEVLIHDWEADSISAVDFDYINNCLYWADNDLHKIRVRHLFRGSSRSIHDYEGDSISAVYFNYINNCLYWADNDLHKIRVRHLFRGSSRSIHDYEGDSISAVYFNYINNCSGLIMISIKYGENTGKALIKGLILCYSKSMMQIQ